MAHPARLLNKITLAFLFLAGCNAPVEKNIQYEIVNENDSALHPVNGILYYHNQLFTGTVFSLFSNSKDIAATASYAKGKENGIWKKWHTPGKPKEQREFLNGAKTGTYTAYWLNGNKQLEYTFSNDEYEGACYEWNSNGMLAKEMHYAKGHEEGVQKMFYDNGKIRSNYIMINGRRYGLLGTKNCVNVSDSIFKK